MTLPPPTGAQAGLQQHRRESRIQLWLPLLGAFVLPILLALLLILPQDAGTADRAAAVASLFLIVACLIPGILLLLAVYGLAVAGILGMNMVHRMSIPPLQRVELLTFQTRQKVEGWSARANRSALRWGALLAPLDGFFTRIERSVKEIRDDRE